MLVNMSGGKKVENIINEIVEPVLLWTNPNPTASFSAQSVTVNGAEYDAYIIECRTSGTVANTGKAFINIGSAGVCATPWETAGASAHRLITNTTKSSITFGVAYPGASNTGGTGYAIPTRIWGVKYTL